MAQGVEFSPSSGWGARPGPAVQVGPNPTVFAFWRSDLSPRFEAQCEADARPLDTRIERLTSAERTSVARVQVDSGTCARFVVRAVREGSYATEEAHYVVNAALSTSGERPQPFLTSAVRENKQFGCGPSDNIGFETNVRPAALRVEVEPGAHTVVVPARLGDEKARADQRGAFWLGRTMCRGPNYPLLTLDRPMTVRVTGLYADGSVDVGPWQSVAAPSDDARGQDETAYVVESPPSPPPPVAVQGASARADAPESDRRVWLWVLLATPGLLALLGWVLARRRALQRDPPMP